MANIKVISALCVVVCILPGCFGWFETCNKAFTIAAGASLTINSPKYSGTYDSGSSCRYNLTTASGYGINLQCTITLDTYGGNCYSEYFYVSSDADPDLLGAEYFCGYGSVQRTSLFNLMNFAYTSYGYGSGKFTCVAKSYLQSCDCGWSKSSKIVGGTPTGVNEYISMVGLVDLQAQTPSAEVYCGGAIIHYRYILTAAHCINAQPNVNYVGALVGDHDISQGMDTPFALLYRVSKMIIHESYNSNTDINDIGIIKTTTDIQYSRAVGPVCLPFFLTEFDFTGSYLDAVGWGSLDFAAPKSDILLKAQLQVISQSTCAPQFPNLIAKQFCTYTKNKDSCQSDSGGSLYYKSPRLYSIGLVGYGYYCASTLPSVNTRVVSYLDWIKLKCNDVTFCEK